MKKVRVAFFGFGNCGKAAAELLCKKHDEIVGKFDTDVAVTHIVTGSHGYIEDPEGIDLKAVLSGTDDYEWRCDRDSIELSRTAEYDVMVEMSPLDIFTAEPATTHIRNAFERGRYAVTSNKGPIAWNYRELRDIADERDLGFFFETVVLDGTPVFGMAESELLLAEVTEISGILNTTTNFILDELAAGCEYDDIMARGRSIGFIEKDSSLDIEGYDAAAKITSLANALMDACITPEDVDRKGIEDITMDDIRDAEAEGKVIKLMCRCEKKDGKVTASVGPERVSKTSLPATICGTTSLLSITTDLMRTISFIEHDPIIEQTAYGVFSDIVRAVRKYAQVNVY